MTLTTLLIGASLSLAICSVGCWIAARSAHRKGFHAGARAAAAARLFTLHRPLDDEELNGLN